MSQSQGEIWDQKYEQGIRSLTVPDPFFISAYARFAEGRFPDGRTALDVAGGVGRHALWLAARGWQVGVVDVSEVAIATIRQEADQRNFRLDLFAIDAAEFHFEAEKYDVVILFYHFDRTLFPRIVSALRSGGLFICKMALSWGTGGPTPSAANLLKRNELVGLVPELSVVEYKERPVRDRGVVEMVGTKL